MYISFVLEFLLNVLIYILYHMHVIAYMYVMHSLHLAVHLPYTERDGYNWWWWHVHFGKQALCISLIKRNIYSFQVLL